MAKPRYVVVAVDGEAADRKAHSRGRFLAGDRGSSST
jgi:hypothetical protein